MRVSLKATYGIMAALDLALQNGSAPVQAKAIAKRQAIPLRFLEQVLHAMKKAGIVDSLRGAQGGYTLGKKPEDVSLAEIVEALDGPLAPGMPRGSAARATRTSIGSMATGCGSGRTSGRSPDCVPTSHCRSAPAPSSAAR